MVEDPAAPIIGNHIIIGKVCKTGPNSSQAIKSIDCVLNAVYYILVILFIYLQCCYKLKDPFFIGIEWNLLKY